MRSTSRIPLLLTTWRLLIPEAFSMNSLLESGAGVISPAAMASALSWLKRSDQALKLATSSSLLMLFGWVYKPVPLMTTFCTVGPLLYLKIMAVYRRGWRYVYESYGVAVSECRASQDSINGK